MCVSVCGHGSGHGVLFIYWGRVPVPVFLCGSVSLPLFTEITSKYPCKCVYVCVCADGLCPLFPGHDASKRHVFMCVRNRFFPLWCNQRVCTSLETALKFKPGFFKKNQKPKTAASLCQFPVQLCWVMRLCSEKASSPQHALNSPLLFSPSGHRFLDVGVDATAGDGVFDDCIQLLMLSNGLLKMSWGWSVWPSDALMQALPTSGPLKKRITAVVWRGQFKKNKTQKLVYPDVSLGAFFFLIFCPGFSRFFLVPKTINGIGKIHRRVFFSPQKNIAPCMMEL